MNKWALLGSSLSTRLSSDESVVIYDDTSLPRAGSLSKFLLGSWGRSNVVSDSLKTGLKSISRKVYFGMANSAFLPYGGLHSVLTIICFHFCLCE